MNWQDEIRRSFRDRGVTPDDDVVLELAQYAESADEGGRAEGLPADEVRARVRALVDGWCDSPRVATRRTRTLAPNAAPPGSASGAAGVGMDVSYAFRLMRRQPGFSGLTILTLALAIAATTTLASVAYGVLARPLPWPQADRLIRVVESREGSTSTRRIMTNVAYHSWEEAATAVDGLAGYSSTTVTLDAGDGPERVPAAVATASLFELLGAVPVRGRLIGPGDEVSRDVALVSAGFWQRRLGGSEGVLEHTISINGKTFAIVGVLPTTFAFPERDTEIWTPMRVDPLQLENGVQTSLNLFSGIGRLAPGRTADEAAREATTALRNGPEVGMVATAVFGSQGEPRVNVTLLGDAMTAQVRPALVVLLAGVALLFTAAIAGVAVMQIARAVSRRREVAIRAAIGAGNGRIARQLLIEHITVGLLGGAGGLGLAALLHAALPSLLPADFPRVDDIVLDWRIAVFAVGLALAASIGTALFPMLQARRLNLVTSLVDGGQAPTGVGIRTPVARLRAAALVGQVAVTVVLLVGAMLVARSFVALSQFDRGYDPVNVLTARVPLSQNGPSPATRQAFEDILARLEALPTVGAAGFSSDAPFMPGGSMMGFTLQAGQDGREEERSAKSDLSIISPGFIEALGLRVVEGRALDASDTLNAEPVAMVNEAFAREYLGDRTVGATLPLGFLDDLEPDDPNLRTAWRIVGIAADTAPPQVTDPVGPKILVSSRQLGVSRFGVTDARFVIRTTGDPMAVHPALRQITREVAPGTPLDSVMTMEDRVSTSLSQPRLYAFLLGGFAGFALLVAAVGLFAVLSHTVVARHRELGVRLALGATPSGLLSLVVGDGLKLTLAGLVIGLGITALTTRYLGSLLFGVTASDPLSYVAGAAIALAGGVLACAIPAARAARVSPIDALRS